MTSRPSHGVVATAILNCLRDAQLERHAWNPEIVERIVTCLATALICVVARERSKADHRLMADDLNISPLAAEMIFQALRSVVPEHYDIKAAGASLDEPAIDNGDEMTANTADDGNQ